MARLRTQKHSAGYGLHMHAQKHVTVSLQVEEPEPEPPAPSCPRWRLKAYPSLNDGGAFVLREADGDAVPNGIQDVTVVRH